MTTVAENKKAYFEYEVLEKFEAGIRLYGFEVKAIKQGKANLTGSFVLIKNNEAFIINMNVSPYQAKNTPKWYEPQRTRKLLLKRKEIDYLNGLSSQKRLTLIPLRIFTKDAKIKLEFGVARKKKKAEKREILRERAIKREIQRELKYQI